MTVPHPQKEKGEDAYFIANTETSAGVADGVGGWSEFGIDSGAFAREVRGGLFNPKFDISHTQIKTLICS